MSACAVRVSQLARGLTRQLNAGLGRVDMLLALRLQPKVVEVKHRGASWVERLPCYTTQAAGCWHRKFVLRMPTTCTIHAR